MGDNTPLVITISRMVAAILSMSDKLSKKLDVTDFKQGDVSFKVKSLDGQHPLIPVGSERMKTEYLFKDGKPAGRKMEDLQQQHPARMSTGLSRRERLLLQYQRRIR